MKIVKLTFNFDWPIFRQTPSFSKTWGDYKFVIDSNLKECDFWIVYTSYNFTEQRVKCNPENIIFLPGECFSSGPRYTQKFLDQFGAIITVQRELKHRRIIYSHNANPWFLGKSFDELSAMTPSNKTKDICVISSNRTKIQGHRNRLDFIEKLKQHFGNSLHVYGKGINEFDDKWDVLRNYKYSIVIENDYCEDWVTEKYFDSLYSNTLAFYYGCPNLENYVDSRAFIRIDIHETGKAIEIIEQSMNNDEYSKRTEILQMEKLKSLSRDQFFPFIVTILNTFDPTLKKKNIKLLENKDYSFKKRAKRLLQNLKTKINH